MDFKDVIVGMMGERSKPSESILKLELDDYNNLAKHSETNADAASELLSAVKVFKKKLNLDCLLDHERAASKEVLQMLIDLNSVCKVLDDLVNAHKIVMNELERVKDSIEKLNSEKLEKFEGDAQ